MRITFFHEAEELYKRPEQLTLRRSLDSITQDDCVSKTAHLWDCCKRCRDRDAGYLYTFRIKPEYNCRQAAEDKIKALFPALEPLVDQLDILNLDYARPRIHLHAAYHARDCPIIKKRADIPGLLGYSYTGSELTLPDRTALLARWHKLREEFPQLPPLDIKTCQGISGDLEFVEAFIAHDGLLSIDKEFVHDHIYHILPLLLNMYDELMESKIISFKALQRREVRSVAHFYAQLMAAHREIKAGPLHLTKEEYHLLRDNIDILTALAGILADRIAARLSFPRFEYQERNYEEQFLFPLDNDNYQHYLHQRFDIDSKKLHEVKRARDLLNRL